jgi:hypothetical protein
MNNKKRKSDVLNGMESFFEQRIKPYVKQEIEKMKIQIEANVKMGIDLTEDHKPAAVREEVQDPLQSFFEVMSGSDSEAECDSESDSEAECDSESESDGDSKYEAELESDSDGGSQ